MRIRGSTDLCSRGAIFGNFSFANPIHCDAAYGRNLKILPSIYIKREVGIELS